MPSLGKIANTLLSYPHARRNRSNPFEFGPVRSEDRMMVGHWVRLGAHRNSQGELLTPQSSFDTGFILPGQPSPDIAAAASAFRMIQARFENRALEKRLRPWTLLGFMSDSMVPNGMARIVEDARPDTYFINVTAGVFFHTLFAALHITADPRFEPDLPHGAGHIEGTLADAFAGPIQVPLDAARQQLAKRFAAMALLACFHHELAHILRAHLPYLARRQGNAPVALTERGHDLPAQETPNLLARAIELDADDFAGRFLAQDLGRGLAREAWDLEHPIFRRRALDILSGVTLMYSWFTQDSDYHGGAARAYLLLGSMLSELKIAPKVSSRWVYTEITALQRAMQGRGLLPIEDRAVSEADMEAMNATTLALREETMRDWLAFRPWGHET